jgi:hypothetical protein
MEGVPLFNHEDNSEDSGNEFGVDDKSKKKSKKKTTPEWFRRIVNTGEQQPDDESKTGRLLGMIKSPFSRLFGIEKDELPEEDSGQDDKNAQDAEYRLPFIGGAFSAVEAVEPDQPELAVDPADTEPDNPHGLIIDEETAEEFATWEVSTEPAGVAEMPEESPRLEDEQEVVESRDPEELSVDRLRAEVEAHALASSETPTERSPETSTFDSATRGEAVTTTKEREIIIEKRGGAGAAAVGFVAADLLSRSRDRKIRKEAKQLKKKVTTLEKKQKTDHQRAQEIEAQNKERTRDLAAKREFDKQQHSEALQAVAPGQDKQPIITKTEQVAIAPKPRTESSPPLATEQKPNRTQLESEQRSPVAERQAADTYSTTREALARQNQELLATIEQAKEVSYAGETYYDRQHEVMDEPTLYDMNSGTSVTAQSQQATTVNSVQQPATSQSYRQPAQPYETLPQKAGLTEEYKQAMIQGATTGIILLVGFLIVLILWSLL